MNAFIFRCVFAYVLRAYSSVFVLPMSSTNQNRPLLSSLAL